jgi:hypothetical protein
MTFIFNPLTPQLYGTSDPSIGHAVGPGLVLGVCDISKWDKVCDIAMPRDGRPFAVSRLGCCWEPRAGVKSRVLSVKGTLGEASCTFERDGVVTTRTGSLDLILGS